MSTNSSRPADGDGNPSDGPQAFTQQFQQPQVGALVPERVSRGVLSTGVMVLQGPYEFVLDFILRMNRPYQVVARVILPVGLMPALIAALRDNAGMFEKKFGPIPQMPVPPQPAQQPSIEDIYSDLKVPDDVLSGTYANHVMIVHSPAEFCFEFITRFFPRAAVSTRVMMSAPQIPGVLNTLTRSWEQFQRKTPGHPGQHQPPI